MKIFLLLSSLFVSFCLYGQSDYIVTGTVRDSTGQVVIGANVWLMTANDTLRGMSNKNGSFRITGIKSQAFKLRVTSLGYEVWEKTSLPGGSLDFQIVLKTGMKMLREFVVKGIVQPVTYKKDTVEYDTKGFIFSEHDMVEDLMKRLPGLEVNSDGTISMMGQKVTKIMINGQEFLVNDIKTLTSLVPAYLINKIQLIDDHGDINRMRGTSRGETQKIINLTTSESIKDIIAGRLSSQYGEYGLYRLAASAFRFNDQQEYHIALANSNMGQYTGKANNSDIDIGLRKKISDKVSFNTGIYYKSENTEIISNNSIETITSDGTLYNNINSNGNSQSENGTFNSEWKINPDKNNKLIIHLDGDLANGENYSEITNIQSGFQRKDQFSINSTKNKSNLLKGNLFFTHFFKKNGRNLAFSYSGNFKDNGIDLDSKNRFRYYYNADTTQFQDSSIHQLINRNNDISENKLEVSYIEPIGDKKNFELRYSYLNSLFYNDYKTKIEETSGKLVPIDSLSNNFNYIVRQMESEITYEYKSNRLNYWIGGNISSYKLLGPSKKIGFSFFPVLQFDYKFSKNSFVRMLYKGENAFPTYNQLSSVPDYLDLQNPVIGNPDLKPANNHSLTIEYRGSKRKCSLFSNFSFDATKNNITTNVLLVEDKLGTVKQETHFLNTNEKYSLGNKSGWSGQVGERSNINLEEGIFYSTNDQYYDLTKWKITSLKANIRLGFEFVLGFWSTSSNITYSYNKNDFGVNNVAINIHSINYYGYNHFKITKNISMEITYSGQKNYSLESAFRYSSLIVESRASFRWLNSKLITSLNVNNLLNNKANASQILSNNLISSTNVKNRGRYVMINILYDFRRVNN
ncbi:TonB-dependent receptor [Chitinophaga sp. LS1]|uniref:TonB-dependent receptor n=1 Tax=Chitinophaga sp. LS1 TaxID=3051176 RepID=UPI002AAC2B1F|nr:TonB-dependent receptor [Chitinophaga sp. LS1]WPV67827.1 TonB-dependent receptor [Chitinophaga sp. LS1]